MMIVGLVTLGAVCGLGGFLVGRMRGWRDGYYHAWNSTKEVRNFVARAMIRQGWVRQRGQPALPGTDVYDPTLKAYVLRPELVGVGGEAIDKWLADHGHEIGRELPALGAVSSGSHTHTLTTDHSDGGAPRRRTITVGKGSFR